MLFDKAKRRRSSGEPANAADPEQRALNSPAEVERSTGSASSLHRLANSDSANNRSADRLLGSHSHSLTLIDEPNELDLQNRNKPRFPSNKSNTNTKFDTNPKRPTLAKAETIDEDHHHHHHNFGEPSNAYQQSDKQQQQQQQSSSCTARVCRLLARRSPILIPLIIMSCMAAIYCIPYVEINPQIPKRLPDIPFNFRDGPLKPSNAELFKAEHLFNDQIHGAESIALDSLGNMYLAIEGGFVLYAHLNASSPPNRAYFTNRTSSSSSSSSNANSNSNPNYPQDLSSTDLSGSQSARLQQLGPHLVALGRAGSRAPDLIKIAELNPIKQVPYEQRKREGFSAGSESGWRRECQLDERNYGKNLWSPNDPDENPQKYASKVRLSRCSKPLGIRLSPDESYLYVIDTLSGLYRIHLRSSERQHSTQRLVNKLIDFKSNRNQLLPVTFFDLAAGQGSHLGPSKRQATALELEPPSLRVPAYLNISLRAVDDLVVDYKAGSQGGDVIYMSVGSQNWHAVSFFYDLLEGRPSGAILRYDTGTNQLTVLSPNQIAHVRTSTLKTKPDESSWFSWDDTIEDNSLISNADQQQQQQATSNEQPNLMLGPNDNNQLKHTIEPVYLRIGAPRLDENDIFDDRSLHFPNGLEMTDDKQALLIADTANKRIIKHFIRGPRKGTSDLWVWTPNYPDNIRRGYEKGRETYWVAGCGHDTTDKIDLMAWLHSWPRLRKFILKNVYLFGWIVESMGADLFGSNRMRDFGYSIRMGHSLCQSLCSGMMILQYNSNGDLIKSIHSEEFPNDLAYYSQANEVIDSNTQQHYLYLSSPQYNYVTKLMLPNESARDFS